MAWLKSIFCKLFGWMCSEEPEPPPPPPEPPPPERPRVDRGVDWKLLRGVTGFALYMQDRLFIRDFCDYILGYEYNWIRCGSQTDGWRGFGVPYLHAGPEPGTAEWRKALDTLLDETARHKNLWIQLIPTFTHKQDNMGSQAENVKYFKNLCDYSIDIVMNGFYRHVFWEAFNEPVHPLSQHVKDEDVREICLYLQDRTGLPVGVDHHGRMKNGEWDPRYPYIWRSPVTNYYAFHPPRNPSPPTQKWVEAAERYNVHVLFDETTCWASQEEIDAYGLRDKGTVVNLGHGDDSLRKDLIIREMNKAKAAAPNGHWLFHSIWGIESNSYGWLPRY